MSSVPLTFTHCLHGVQLFTMQTCYQRFRNEQLHKAAGIIRLKVIPTETLKGTKFSRPSHENIFPFTFHFEFSLSPHTITHDFVTMRLDIFRGILDTSCFITRTVANVKEILSTGTRNISPLVQGGEQLKDRAGSIYKNGVIRYKF